MITKDYIWIVAIVCLLFMLPLGIAYIFQLDNSIESLIILPIIFLWWLILAFTERKYDYKILYFFDNVIYGKQENEKEGIKHER